jgi:ribosomal protein S6
VGGAKLNTYEGLFIFADTLKEEELKEALDGTMSMIQKQGGSVLGLKKIGRRNFARTMHKRDSGIYVRSVFNLDPSEISPLISRYNLSDDVFRVQITRGDSKSLEFVANLTIEEAEKKAKADSVE